MHLIVRESWGDYVAGCRPDFFRSPIPDRICRTGFRTGYELVLELVLELVPSQYFYTLHVYTQISPKSDVRLVENLLVYYRGLPLNMLTCQHEPIAGCVKGCAISFLTGSNEQSKDAAVLDAAIVATGYYHTH